MDTFCKFLGVVITLGGVGIGAASLMSAVSLGEGAASGMLFLIALAWAFGGVLIGAAFFWMGKVYQKLEEIFNELKDLNRFD